MEIWAYIEGFRTHQISNLGRVRSCIKNTSTYIGKILKYYLDKDGYQRLSLFKDGKKYPRYVHILVAKEFVPNPKNLPQVNHKDGNKNNPAASNLEWRSDLGNKNHAVKTGVNKARGISFNKRRGTWHAYINVSGFHQHLGSFTNKKEALAVRKEAIRRLDHVE